MMKKNDSYEDADIYMYDDINDADDDNDDDSIQYYGRLISFLSPHHLSLSLHHFIFSHLSRCLSLCLPLCLSPFLSLQVNLVYGIRSAIYLHLPSSYSSSFSRVFFTSPHCSHASFLGYLLSVRKREKIPFIYIFGTVYSAAR